MTNSSFPLSKRRELDCQIERHALEMWLSCLTPIRWLTTIGTTVLSAVAGATILGKPAFLGEHNYTIVAGLCALGASILSGLHAALHCDAHQAECRRLIGVFAGLEAGYQATQGLEENRRNTKERELERRFEETITGRTTTPPLWFRQRAERVWNPGIGQWPDQET